MIMKKKNTLQGSVFLFSTCYRRGSMEDPEDLQSTSISNGVQRAGSWQRHGVTLGWDLDAKLDLTSGCQIWCGFLCHLSLSFCI